MDAPVRAAAELLEEGARHAAASQRQSILWRDLGIEATKAARNLRALLDNAKPQ